MPFTHGFALLIGVDQSAVAAYALPEVANDIDALARVLTHPDRCAYPPDHVKTITGPDATRIGILDGLAWLGQQLADDDNATAVIYYSGHGWRDTEASPADYYFIPYDIHEQQVRTRALRAGDFAAAVADLAPKRLLVLLDCCHAGGMGVRDLRPVRYRTEAVPEELVSGALAGLGSGTGRAVISSSRGDQVSFSRSDRTMGIFSYHLIEALTGHAEPKEGDSQVLVTDVVSYLQRSVPASAKAQTGSDQQPVVEISGTAFPVALLLGGKGLARGLTAPDPLSLMEGLPNATTSVQGNRNVTVAGNIKGGAIITGDSNTVQTATGNNIAQASGGGSATVNDHSSHSAFDQRGQTVGTQYNIAGDYNPAAAQDRASAVDELRRLIDELNRARDEDALPTKIALVARQSVENALVEAEEPQPDKRTILNYLAAANEVITTAAGATALVTAVTQAIQMVQKLF